MARHIETDTLRTWLDHQQPVTVLRKPVRDQVSGSR